MGAQALAVAADWLGWLGITMGPPIKLPSLPSGGFKQGAPPTHTRITTTTTTTALCTHACTYTHATPTHSHRVVARWAVLPAHLWPIEFDGIELGNYDGRKGIGEVGDF